MCRKVRPGALVEIIEKGSMEELEKKAITGRENMAGPGSGSIIACSSSCSDQESLESQEIG